MEEQLKRIVEKLIEKTTERNVIWEKTTGNGFKIALSGSTIAIQYYEGTYEDEPYPYCSLFIFNDKGDKIDYYNLRQKDDDFDLLFNLYDKANKSYYKVEETYQNIIEELDKNDIIGENPKKHSNNAEPDDLPF
jgi:hypothetical protein